MKLIRESDELSLEFRRLMNKYKEYLWAIAWADFDFEFSDLLIKNKSKIKKLCVGLQFYGTHPFFLEAFYENHNVKFIDKYDGTFHPKLYLFKNNETDWELLIGSNNYTLSAFKKNVEISILLTSYDIVSDKESLGNIYENSIEFINSQWRKGKYLDYKYIKEYRKRKKRVKIHLPKPPSNGIRYPVFEKTWKEYLIELKQNDYKSRIKFLNWVKREFQNESEFHKIKPDIRKSIAGFGQGETTVDFKCFGTTGARYSFMNKVNEDPKIISQALKRIPKKGEVSKIHYQNFIKEFRKVSPYNEIACATRLLCLWRPDYFVTFNSKNEKRLCEDLNIKKRMVNYESYWDLIVQPFINSDWDEINLSKSREERKIHSCRIALLDCIYYEPD